MTFVRRNLSMLLLFALFFSGTNNTLVVYEPGFCLMPNWQSPVTFAVIHLHKGEIIDKTVITSREFALICSGHMRSKANINKEDLFEIHSIQNCEVEYDAPASNHVVNCQILDDLWKLRYKIKPGDFKKDNESTSEEGKIYDGGWAFYEESPNQNQREKLKEFGIFHLDDYVYGENAFRLIRAASNPSWTSSYRE